MLLRILVTASNVCLKFPLPQTKKFFEIVHTSPVVDWLTIEGWTGAEARGGAKGGVALVCGAIGGDLGTVTAVAELPETVCCGTTTF